MGSIPVGSVQDPQKPVCIVHCVRVKAGMAQIHRDDVVSWRYWERLPFRPQGRSSLRLPSMAQLSLDL